MFKSRKKMNVLSFGILLILSITALSFISPKKVDAEEKDFQVTPGCFDEYTDSMNLYDEKTGMNLNEQVWGYLDYFKERYKYVNIPAKEWDNSIRSGYLEDEWILKIVPKELFANEGQYFYIGKYYGFLVNTVGDKSFVYLITIESNIFKTTGVLDLKIEPFFNYTYRYDKQINKAYAIPNHIYLSNTYVVGYNLELVQLTSLSNISFSGALYNKYYVNQNQEDYNAYEDKGLFFYGTNYEYLGRACRANNSAIYDKAIIDLLVNFIPGGKIIGVAKDAYAIYNYIDTVTDKQTKHEISVRSSEAVNLQLSHNTREAQLSEFGYLLKDGFAACNSSEEDPVLFAFGNGHYAKASFFIGGENRVATRFSGTISMKVFRESNENNEITQIFDTITSTPFYCDIYEGEEEFELTEDKPGAVYLLQNEEANYYFTAPQKGQYTFSTYGEVPNTISVQGSVVTTSDNKRCNTAKVNLSKGQTVVIKTSAIESNVCSNYNISVEFTPPKLQIGTNIVNFDDSNTEYFDFISTEELYYEFLIEDSAAKLALFDSDFNLLHSSDDSSLETVLNSACHYYLQIIYTDHVSKNVTIKIADKMYVHFKDSIDNTVYDTIVISGGVPFTWPEPQKIGYDFCGWWTSLEEQITKENVQDNKQPDLYLQNKWSAKAYTIKYVVNGGSEVTDESYFYDEEKLLPTDIVKENSIFKGWYDNEAFQGDPISRIKKYSTEDKTFYARWIRSTFSIHLNVNAAYTDGVAAKLSDSGKVVDYGKKYILPVPDFDGFLFNGWYHDNKKYTDSNGYSLNIFEDEEDINLVANWTREKYYIRIDIDGTYKWLKKNGEDFQFSDAETTVENEINLCPNCYVRAQIARGGDAKAAVMTHLYKEGNIFQNIIKDKNDPSSLACWNIFEIGQTYNNNDIIELYADYKKEKDFKIYVEENYDIIVYADYGDEIRYNHLPEKTGHSFSHFIVSNNSMNRAYEGTQFAPGNRFAYTYMPDLSVNEEMDGAAIYLMPMFTPNEYTVSFKNTDTPLADKKVIFGNPYNHSNHNAFPTVYRKGHSFGGWYTEEGAKKTDASGNLIECWDISNDCPLYANWMRNTYTITFNFDGGSNGDKSKKVTYNDFLPSAKAPIRDGYRFMGYYTGLNGTGKQYYTSSMTPSTLWSEDSDTTLYAYWEKIYYSIRLDYQDDMNGYDNIQVAYREMMPNHGQPAPTREGYDFLGYYTQPGGMGVQYYGVDVNSHFGSRLYYHQTLKSIKQWDKLSNETLYAHWKILELNYEIQVVVDQVGSLPSRNVAIKHGDNLKLTAEEIQGYTFKYWWRAHIEYNTKTVTFACKLKRSEKDFSIYLVDAFSIYYAQNECVTGGTLITLADGSQVPVETLRGDEELLVWNLRTGQFDTAPILFIDSDPLANYKVINLYFSDGTQVKIISEHGFWDFNLNCYVQLREDAAKYIGHFFNKQTTDLDGNLSWTKVQLVNVVVNTEYTTAWSPVTYGHLCLYVNGMLSMPGATEGLINIFQVDGETMRYDEVAFQSDIEAYGLFTYEEFSELFNASREIYEAVSCQYLKISIAKGLIDYSTIEELIKRYGQYFVR